MAAATPPAPTRDQARAVPRPRPHDESAPLRVLIGTDTYPPDVNGASFFTARLATGLARRGSDVHVLCQSTDGPPYLDRVDGVWEHRLRSVSSLVHESIRLTLPLGVPGHVDRLLARLRPDVIHIQHHFIVGRLLLAAARRRRLPVVATNHFMPENLFNYVGVPEPLREPVAGLAWRDFNRALAGVGHVTTPTRIAVQLLLDNGFTRPVEAVSCGIDLSRFQPPDEVGERGRFRAHLGLADRPTVAYVGRLDEEKRVEELIAGLAAVTVEDAQLVVVGTGAQRRRLERHVEREGVGDRVHFLGFVPDDDLPLVYRAADVFAIAGVAELQCIAALEAMASGLPVVAADAMALPHLVVPGYNGHLYPPGDIARLAGHLSALLAAPEDRARMGEASREIAMRHDHQSSLARYEEIYRGIARSSAARTG